MLPPYWLILWHVGALMRVFGEPAELARQGQTFLRAYMWCAAPWLLFQLLRNFVAALERPPDHIVAQPLRDCAQCAAQLVTDLRPFRASGVRAGGRRHRQHPDLDDPVRCPDLHRASRPPVSPLSPVRARVEVRSAAHMEMTRLGWPIGVTMALEMGVFALAAYFMGWIGAPAVAAHAVALQLAALTFMVPLGLGQAATVRCRARAWPER